MKTIGALPSSCKINTFNQIFTSKQFYSNSAFSVINFKNKLNFPKSNFNLKISASEARVPPTIPLPTPPITKFKIALCQLSVTTNKERNIAHARNAIQEAAGKGAKLVLLPEIWNSPYSNDSFPVYAEDIDASGEASPSTAMLSEVAKSLKITIVGGSIPERSGNKLYNACCVFDTDGKLKAKHRKIHLFDIDIPGQMTFKESMTLTAGETPTIVDTDVGRIGIGICYDIRFQELAAIYAARGAHLLCYPGAFNMTTGPLHWELLQRARAADCQLYVATCAPARDINSSYVAWGHSTLVGPFGEVLATTEHDEAILIADIDYSLIEQRRMYLPFQTQRRGDLYQLVDVHRLNADATN
ncbi:hydrolase [Lithospermum erythrorhizon]|uniref:Hydrolase n=1 Tax=Lithospermum erythrorhizon TaxID=34254 RepID=A0AAV3R2I8_LITER